MNRRTPSLISLGLAACCLLVACGETPAPPAAQTAPAEPAAPASSRVNTNPPSAAEPAVSGRPEAAQDATPETAQAEYEEALENCDGLHSERGKDKCRAAAASKFAQASEQEGVGAPDEAAAPAAANEPGSPKE
jgi:hypothetical protein